MKLGESHDEAITKSKVLKESSLKEEESVESDKSTATSEDTKESSKQEKEIESVDFIRKDVSAKKKRKRERVAVVNANGDEGASIVRTLAKKDFDVLAIVRVATSRHTLSFMRIENVKVEVADSRFDSIAIAKLIKGCRKVFFVTQYWEKFADKLEETQVFTIFKACGDAKVRKVVFTTYEDVGRLTAKGLCSQITAYGRGMKPQFEGMKEAKAYAKSLKISVVHMITSYLDQETSKRSLCMIADSKGDLVVTSEF